MQHFLHETSVRAIAVVLDRHKTSEVEKEGIMADAIVHIITITRLRPVGLAMKSDLCPTNQDQASIAFQGFDAEEEVIALVSSSEVHLNDESESYNAEMSRNSSYESCNADVSKGSSYEVLMLMCQKILHVKVVVMNGI